jgi:arginyl-tRNA synthetase
MLELSMVEFKQKLLEVLQTQANVLCQEGGLAPVTVALERPKLAEHGDVACTAALQLAKPLKRNPREVAQSLISACLADAALAGMVLKAEIAGPGFINFTATPAIKQSVVKQVLRAASAYGTSGLGAGEKVMVEFVSANPTGPLHVGHGRQAALGDAICSLLETQGFAVMREFYYNDAGVQINNLAVSVQARCFGHKPGDEAWPESAYNGDYIRDIAEDFLACKTVSADDRSFTASGDANDLDGIRQFAVAYLRHEQDLDLKAFNVKFDHYFLESSLYTEGRVEQAVNAMISGGHTYEADGALWLRSTDYGDDKDRVMRKGDGSYTYFVPDVAYHVTKFQRGYQRATNIQGGDHHGTIARVRAGLQATNMGIPQGYPSYALTKMVRVVRGGVEVKISKRDGNYVTLRDLIFWCGENAETGEHDVVRGKDAVRFFLITRKADTEFTFDIDLALKQNDENPAFYVQYAHARICSVIANALSTYKDEEASYAKANLSPLTAPSELALISLINEYPGMLARAAADLSPHDVAFYLRDLSGAFHSFYGAQRVLVDNAPERHARLALLAATRQVLQNGLQVLGVSAPQRM